MAKHRIPPLWSSAQFPSEWVNGLNRFALSCHAIKPSKNPHCVRGNPPPPATNAHHFLPPLPQPRPRSAQVGAGCVWSRSSRRPKEVLSSAGKWRGDIFNLPSKWRFLHRNRWALIRLAGFGEGFISRAWCLMLKEFNSFFSIERISLFYIGTSTKRENSFPKRFYCRFVSWMKKSSALQHWTLPTVNELVVASFWGLRKARRIWGSSMTRRTHWSKIILINFSRLTQLGLHF